MQLTGEAYTAGVEEVERDGVNLTTLAPDIVTAILDDAMPNHVTLFDLAVDPPALWGRPARPAQESGQSGRFDDNG